MSLYIDFEPHSWYMGFAIKKTASYEDPSLCNWYAYTDDGNTYQVIEYSDDTLKQLKKSIKQYRINENKRTARLYSGAQL